MPAWGSQSEQVTIASPRPRPLDGDVLVVAAARHLLGQPVDDALEADHPRPAVIALAQHGVEVAVERLRAERRELQSLDNRTLRDIGIGRSEIEWRVAGGDESRVTQRPAAMGSKPCADASARRNHRHGAEKRAA